MTKQESLDILEAIAKDGAERSDLRIKAIEAYHKLNEGGGDSLPPVIIYDGEKPPDIT